MPDVIAIPSENILPVWDSFEATFFVAAGVIVGFVFGYLFPSVWRTLRRRFRPHRQYLISDLPWERNLNLKIQSLTASEQNVLSHYKVVELFVIARDLFQKKEYRHAVRVYGQILTSTQATTPHIHQAMFELAQVYFALDLYTRAFDTAFEVLKKKLNDGLVVQFLLNILHRYFDEERLQKLLNIFKTTGNEQLRNQMSFIICEYAMKYLKKDNDHGRALAFTKLALRIKPQSTYAQAIVWQACSIKMYRKKTLDIKSQWIIFAEDLISWIKLCKEYNLSVSAGTSYLETCFSSLFCSDQKLEALNEIKQEVEKSLNYKQMSLDQKTLVLQIFFEFAFNKTKLKNKNELVIYRDFIMQILGNDILVYEVFNLFFLFPNEKKFVNDMLNPEIIKMGFKAHQCTGCKVVYSYFQWRCTSCGLLEPLQVYLTPFMEYAFHDQNWYPNQDNRNRCVDSYTYPQ